MMRSLGQVPLSVPAFLEGSKDLQVHAEQTCGCVLNAAIEKFGVTNWWNAMQQPANQPVMQQIVRGCPNPFATQGTPALR